MNSQSTRPPVAVLGLGIMGAAFARNLLKAGFPVHVWNRSIDKARALQDAGAHVHATAAEAAAAAVVAISMLTTAEVTGQVMLAGEQGGPALEALPQDAVYVQMGTIGLDGTTALARAVAQRRPDLFFVDAPVSGTKGPAEQARITILASSDTLGEAPPRPRGDAAAQAAGAHLAAVFGAISRATVWLGGAGAGTRMKLVVNAWLVSMMEGIAETAALAHALGFNAEQLWATLDGGPLASPYIQGKLGKIGRQDFSTEMALQWGAKDAALALQAWREAAPAELELPGLGQIATLWQAGAEAGYARQDISSMYRYLLGEPASD
jgi:3-hydroxyisobutyrate dehydrogenase